MGADWADSQVQDARRLVIGLVFGWWFFLEGNHSIQAVGPFQDRAACETVRAVMDAQARRTSYFARTTQWCWWDGR